MFLRCCRVYGRVPEPPLRLAHVKQCCVLIHAIVNVAVAFRFVYYMRGISDLTGPGQHPTSSAHHVTGSQPSDLIRTVSQLAQTAPESRMPCLCRRAIRWVRPAVARSRAAQLVQHPLRSAHEHMARVVQILATSPVGRGR